MIRLLKYLRHYKMESIIGPLFKMTEAIFELWVPIVMARIIDEGIRTRQVSFIWQMGGILVILGILGLICSLTAQYFAAKAAVGFGTELRKDVFAHINRLSFREIDQIGTSTLVTRITSDVNQTQTGVNLALRLFLRSPFIVIGSLIMSFRISTKLSLVFVVLVPVLAVIIFGIMALCVPMYKKVQKRLERVLMRTRENLTGVRVVRAFSGQDKEQKGYEEENQILYRMQMLVGRLSAILNPVTYIIINVAIVILMWYGALQVNIGGITQGELIALINYMNQILLALIAFANLIVNYMKGVASAQRIQELLSIESSMEETGTEEVEAYHDEAIRLENVSFRYSESGENVLDHINLSIAKGEMAGIIGSTGSGKSSLIQLMTRFYDTTEGNVYVFGKEVKRYATNSLRKHVKLVMQHAVLFSGTVLDNLRFGNEAATEDECLRALEVAQAKEFVFEKGQGLDFYISEGGMNLSGGQKQRLTIARSVVGNPDILILDDSFSALDYATDAKLRHVLRDMRKNMTIVVVAQRIATIRSLEKIYVLDDGQLVGCGTHEQLVKNCPVYREICQSQGVEE